MEQIFNQAMVIVAASGATLLGLLILQPVRDTRPVSLLRKFTAGWLFAYAFLVLFLQFLRPPFAQSIALVAIAGVFWLLDSILYRSQTLMRRATDVRYQQS